MLFSDMVAICANNRRKQINTLCMQSANVLVLMQAVFLYVNITTVVLELVPMCIRKTPCTLKALLPLFILR
jgi:hypothetical protein